MTSKEYLINSHILMKFFEFFFPSVTSVIILCKLIIISMNYERKKGAFYDTLCNGRIPRKSLNGSD